MYVVWLVVKFVLIRLSIAGVLGVVGKICCLSAILKLTLTVLFAFQGMLVAEWHILSLCLSGLLAWCVVPWLSDKGWFWRPSRCEAL